MNDLRPARPEDIPGLAKLWHAGWHEAHAAYTPEALTRMRTEADFTRRLRDLLPGIRMAGPPLAPLGFCAIRDDELYQLFVAGAARGTGLAARLLADGEARLADIGLVASPDDVMAANTTAATDYTTLDGSELK